MNPKAFKEREAKLFLARSKKKKERRHRRESSSKSSRDHRRHGDSRRVEVGPGPDLHLHQLGAVRPASPEQELPGPSSASMPAPTTQTYPAFPAPGTDPAAFLNAMFNIFSTLAPGGGHAGPSGPLAFNLGAPAPYKLTPFMPFLSSGAAAAQMPLPSPRRPVTPTTSATSALVDSPRIQSTVNVPVSPGGQASDGSEEQRRQRSSASAGSLSTPGLESRLRSRILALRLLKEEEYSRQHLEEGEILEPSGDFQGLDTASGCVLPYSDPQIAQEVSPVCGGFAALSVCGPYFSTLSLHKGDGGGSGRAQKRDSGVSLSGRLVDQSQDSGARAAPPAVDNSVVVRLGFFSQCAKSHLEPSHRLLFIGAILDTTLNLSFPPPQRIQDIQALFPMFRNGAVVPVLKVLRLLGLYASCILLVTHACWHMRALQWCVRRQWFQHKGDLEDSITITSDTVVDLQWWAAIGNLSQGRPLSLPPPMATVVTDDSTLGWGAHLGDLEVKGLWSPVEQRFHINLLELREVRLALKAFLPSIRGQSVQILTDNTTAMWYINKQGGVGSYILCREALRLWSWLQDHKICLVANHLAGVLNVRADVLSRCS
ncbi:hypothetical protein NDU88_006626 [Pleurodeles waltl]|uniref:Reverse transcriptase RNase H-like domain-containing protein n=1 Tax=Pleurodeles waltl TaxID=8319 RepID=A0AAV7LFY0_PLEWA|nr:hypothetical protein NDU88_006626 [Pleurodeles waltl]